MSEKITVSTASTPVEPDEEYLSTSDLRLSDKGEVFFERNHIAIPPHKTTRTAPIAEKAKRLIG
jgi:hypothetical protein